MRLNLIKAMVHEILLYHRAVIFIHKASSKLRKTWLEQIFVLLPESEPYE
jgi:hypothetical protein